MEIEQHERLVFLPAIAQPVEGHVRNDIRHVALYAGIAFAGDEIRVVVITLPGQNFKFIKAFGVVPKVEFAEHGRLIAIIVQDLWKSDVGRIERKDIINFPVDVGVLAGQYSCPGRCTDGIGDRRIREEHALSGEAVDIGRIDQALIVGANGLISMIITHDEYDIGALFRLFGSLLAGRK